MMAQAVGDWSVFKQLFADHWDECTHAHPRYQTFSYDTLVDKMLDGGTPDKMGSIAYRCLDCGQGKHLVSMRCQSSLCLRCAKGAVDNWVRQGSKALHDGVISRHIMLTVPAIFRTIFSQNAAVWLRALMRCGRQCLDACYREVRGQPLTGGSITVLHTHGRNGPYHPHLPLLATRGGYDAAGERWEHRDFLPYDLLRHQWQWHLMTTWRQTRETDAMQRLVAGCFTTYPNGLVSRVQRGKVPSQSQSVARSVAQYVVSPPLSVRRIDRYEGARVTYHYRAHWTDRTAHETVDVLTCIGRMIQHTLSKGFKRIRYDGVQATKTFAQVQVAMQAALAKGQGVVKGAVKIIARLPSRERYEKSTGRDPLLCPHCRSEMGVWRIWHPTYGVVYDEGERIKRGT